MSGNFSLIAIGEIAIPAERAEVPVAGYKYRQLGVQLWGKGAYERETIDGSQTKYNTLSRVEAGDIVVNKIWARNGSVAVVPEKLAGCYVSTEFPTFLPKPDKLIPEWVHWITKTKPFWEQCDEKSRGTSGQNRIRPEKFLEIKIPLPPVEEQRRIVARIEELAAKIEEARGLRRGANEEASLLLALASKSIFEKPTAGQISMEDLVGRANLKNGKSIKTNGVPSGIKCLRLSALRNGRVDCADTKPVPMSVEEASQYRVHPGDVFIVRGNGSKELVGQAGLVTKPSDGVIFPDLFIRVPLNHQQVLPEYFVLWWNSATMRAKIKDVAKTTSGIWKINQGHIASFSVPVPGLEEQRRIVAYLDNLQAKVDALKKLQAETAAELDALLPSILDKAFKGEL